MKSVSSTDASGRRAYRLAKRAVSVQSTKQSILRAATDIAATVGFANVTVDAVAKDAGVSRLTVYNHFQSKAGLLEAVAWSVFASADIDRLRVARQHPDVVTALRGFVTENARFLATIGRQGRTVLAAALAEPELASVIDATYIAGRRSAIVELVERIDSADKLRSGWSRERAVASLMVLTSLESFEAVTVHTGWSTASGGEHLADMAQVVVEA